MTLTMYSIHKGAEVFVAEAERSFQGVSIEGVGTGILLSISARTASLLAVIFASATIVRVPVKVTSRVFVILRDEVSGRAVVRIALSIGSIVALAISRLLVSICGVAVPELVYRSLKMHDRLLWLGLFCRVQAHVFPESMIPMIDRVGDQRLRRNIVTVAIGLMRREEMADDEPFRLGFNERIWQPAIRAVQGEGEERSFFDVFINVLGQQRVFPDFPDLGALADVVPNHPMHRAFFEQLITCAHNAAIWLRDEHLYSPEEIEDLVTAYDAVLNLGVLDLLEQHCFLNDADGTVQFEWQDLDYASAGNLFGEAQAIIRIKRAYGRIPDREKAYVRYYLCADESRIQEGRNLPQMSPTMREFFNLLVDFRVRYVDKQLAHYSNRMQGIFSL